MARKIKSKNYKKVIECKAKRQSYPEGMYNPRTDQVGMTVGYNSSVTPGKSDRPSSAFNEIVSPYSTNPTGRVRRKGSGS